MRVQDVTVTKVGGQPADELSDTYYRVCIFCDKVVRGGPAKFQTCLNLGGGNFFCPFCIRNRHHHRAARNVLVLSCRAVAGYYYYRYYQRTQGRWAVYVSDIEAALKAHAGVGLQHPAFAYDPHTCLWFVDFNRVGGSRRKAPFAGVLETARAAFDMFGVDLHLGDRAAAATWGKFEAALREFDETRTRPPGRRMLVPTLRGAAPPEKDEFWDRTREFIRPLLVVK